MNNDKFAECARDLCGFMDEMKAKLENHVRFGDRTDECNDVLFYESWLNDLDRRLDTIDETINPYVPDALPGIEAFQVVVDEPNYMYGDLSTMNGEIKQGDNLVSQNITNYNEEIARQFTKQFLDAEKYQIADVENIWPYFAAMHHNGYTDGHEHGYMDCMFDHNIDNCRNDK